MYALVLLALMAAEPEAPKPFRFTVEFVLDEKTKIFVDQPFGDKPKEMTKVEFVKNVKELMLRGYPLKKVVSDGLLIKELHFSLPDPEKEEQDDFADL